MYSATFDYFRPKTLAQAAALLRKHRDSRILAGGHSLLPAMKLRLSSPRALVDLSAVKGLSGIQAKGKNLRIGAMTVHAEVASSGAVRKSCPLLAEAASIIGDLQVRNRGTIGGSLAHADPGADYPTLMLALEATIFAKGPRGERKIPANRFFTDLFTTALKKGEILTSVLVPGYGKGTGGAYEKHRHPASSFAVVGVAAIVDVAGGRCRRVRLVVGGVTANPVRCSAAEAALTGQEPDEGSIESASRRVADAISDPLSDSYASGEFRTHLATVLAKRALQTAVERARG
jgi:carbon-monoxide dehydrogenase medium subunit